MTKLLFDEYDRQTIIENKTLKSGILNLYISIKKLERSIIKKLTK